MVERANSKEGYAGERLVTQESNESKKEKSRVRDDRSNDKAETPTFLFKAIGSKLSQ